MPGSGISWSPGSVLFVPVLPPSPPVGGQSQIIRESSYCQCPACQVTILDGFILELPKLKDEYCLLSLMLMSDFVLFILHSEANGKLAFFFFFL